MNREFLEGLGLEKEVIDSIMKEHGKAIQAVKPADDYEELKSTNESLQGQLQQLQDTLDEKETALNGVEDIKQELQKYKIKNLRSEEHTSELQSRGHLVCRLLLEKKKK